MFKELHILYLKTLDQWSAKLKEGYRIYDQFGKDFTRTCKYDLTLTHIHRTYVQLINFTESYFIIGIELPGNGDKGRENMLQKDKKKIISTLTRLRDSL